MDFFSTPAFAKKDRRADTHLLCLWTPFLIVDITDETFEGNGPQHMGTMLLNIQ